MDQEEMLLQEPAVTDIADAGAEPQEPAQGQEESLPEGAVTLGTDGEITLPDSFFDGMGIPEEKTEEAQGTQEPAAPSYYTPEEFAEAFAGGTIDEAKLTPDVAAFYKAAMSRSQPSPEPAQAQPQIQPQIAPQPQRAPVMSKEQYAQLTEAAKNVACANFLGIRPEDFDEFNAEHTQARNFAMQEIRARASEIASQQAAAAARAQALAAEIGALDAEYQRKDPEFFAKHETLMQDYLGRMPFRAAAEAIRAIQSGDVAGIRKFLDGVYSDYKGKGAGGAQQPVKAPQAKQAPPAVMRAAPGGGEERRGYADAAELAGMSADDQANWFLKNGLV
jgi:hypothetical protein